MEMNPPRGAGGFLASSLISVCQAEEVSPG
jgi:hypothetical protein